MISRLQCEITRFLAWSVNAQWTETFDGIVWETFIRIVVLGLVFSLLSWFAVRRLPPSMRALSRFALLTLFMVPILKCIVVIAVHPVRPSFRDLATGLGARYGIMALYGLLLASLLSAVIDLVKRLRTKSRTEPSPPCDVANRAAHKD
jgi:hypothetical protein